MPTLQRSTMSQGTLSTVSAYKIKHKLQMSNIECYRGNSSVSEGRGHRWNGEEKSKARREKSNFYNSVSALWGS